MSLFSFYKTVTSAATPEPLKAAQTLVGHVTIQPLCGNKNASGGNKGRVYVGGLDVSSVTGTAGVCLTAPLDSSAIGSVLQITPGNGLNVIDLSRIYCAVSVDGEGVNVIYEVF